MGERATMLYELPSALIMIVLLIFMLAASEVGRRFGARQAADQKAGHKERTNATLASILATVALLLGFTFTMSVQRFDARSEAAIQEANAIGTAALRSQLLSAAEQSDAQEGLARYIAHRIESVEIDMSHPNARRESDREAKRLQGEIWSIAVAAAEKDANPTRSGLFISALNEMIDTYAARQMKKGREKSGGQSLWWPVVARNKKSITLNLRTPEGQQIVRDLIKDPDTLPAMSAAKGIENPRMKRHFEYLNLEVSPSGSRPGSSSSGKSTNRLTSWALPA